MPPPVPPQDPTFPTLRSQIISLATALYGSPSPSTSTFDVLPFSTPSHTPPSYHSHPNSNPNPNTNPNSSSLPTRPLLSRPSHRLTHGAALIFYTGPAHAPHLSWEMLSYADNHSSVVAGAAQLLEDMQRGVGEVICGLVKRGDWAVRHRTVPDLAIGEHGNSDVEHGDEYGDEYADSHGEGCGNGLGEQRWGQPLGNIDEGDEYAQRERAVM